jgi:hypothetical protein
MDLRDPSIPICFRRTGGSALEPKFSDLKSLKLSAFQKVFLCEEISGEHSLLGLKGPRDASNRYNIAWANVQRWASKHSDGRTVFHDCKGCPACIDEEFVEAVMVEAVVRRENMDPFTQAQLSSALNEARKETDKKCGHQPTLGEMDERTIRKVKTENFV